MERLGPEAERYLRAVVEGLPIWERGEVTDELRTHLGAAIDRRIASGADPTNAENEALTALGPAEQLRRELVQAHRRKGSRLLSFLIERAARVPFDWLAPLKLLRWRPVGNFQHDYTLGRYDAIIARGEHELRMCGPRFGLHHELGLAYNAIGEFERALGHLQQEVAQQKIHPLPRWRGGSMGLATAYTNLVGVLMRLERWDEVNAAIAAGLRADARHGMLHFQRAQRLVVLDRGAEALSELERFLDDGRMIGRERTFLLLAQDPHFDAVRTNPQFQRMVLRAAAG